MSNPHALQQPMYDADAQQLCCMYTRKV